MASRWAPAMPFKQRITTSFQSIVSSARTLSLSDSPRVGPASVDEIFPRTRASVDGEDCAHDCETCAVRYPKVFKVDEHDLLYGHVTEWSTHVLVATGKTDWVRDVADEKGSVMQAIGKADSPTNGKLKLSASNIPTPHGTADYEEPTTVLLLPAFIIIENVTPESVPTMIKEFIDRSPTNSSPLEKLTLPKTIEGPTPLTWRHCPHRVLILLCSQRTRDVRCGQSAPLIRRELERHLRPLGLFRDLDDQRPGGVGIYFISHVGGHKYSANMMVYRRPNAFAIDDISRAEVGDEEVLSRVQAAMRGDENGADGEAEDEVGAGECIWLARVKPEDCENIVRYTVLQGKVVKPETQLRGGFNRTKGLFSW